MILRQVSEEYMHNIYFARVQGQTDKFGAIIHTWVEIYIYGNSKPEIISMGKPGNFPIGYVPPIQNIIIYDVVCNVATGEINETPSKVIDILLPERDERFCLVPMCRDHVLTSYI